MSLERLARLCYRRRRRVLLFWVLLLFGAVFANRRFGAEFSNAFDFPGTESARAFELLEDKFPQQSGDTAFIVFKSEPSVYQQDVQTRMEALFERVRKLPGVISVSSPYDASLFSAGSGKIALAQVQLEGGGPNLPRESVNKMGEYVEQTRGGNLQVELGGRTIQFANRQGPGNREFVGVLAAVVILFVTFGSVIAMGLPLITAIFGLGLGLMLVGLGANIVDAPEFTGQLASMIGLGVGIDYALFIVTRYRQALHSGHAPQEALVISLTTSGRAVIFAGLTVVISVLGMFLMGLSFVRGLAAGAALVVLMTVLAAITLLPAILGFAGHAIDRFRVPFLHRDESAHQSTVWFRWSRLVQRYPWPAALGSLLILLVLGAPVLSLRLGFSDASTGSPDSTTRRAFDLLAEGFGPGFNGPLLLVAELADASDSSRLNGLATKLQGSPGVAFVTPARTNPAGDTAVLTVFPASGPQDPATEKLVHRLRETVIPPAVSGGGLRVSVGGPSALFIDMSELLSRKLPLFMGGVIGLSFLLLLVVFRSLLVPLKAAVMNVLGIGAAFGLVVAIFQWGWAKDIVGVNGTGPIEPFIPMMLFAILFGLSMDYEVFLLSRVREEYLRTRDNAVAVADGLAATARVITAAAAIMVTLFLSFVTLGDDRIIKVFGLGLAMAIFIDATLIRMVLVPATMELLGNANWWFPRWLDRVVPRVAVEARHAADVEEPEPERVLMAVGAEVGAPFADGGNGVDDDEEDDEEDDEYESDEYIALGDGEEDEEDELVAEDEADLEDDEVEIEFDEAEDEEEETDVADVPDRAVGGLLDWDEDRAAVAEVAADEEAEEELEPEEAEDEEVADTAELVGVAEDDTDVYEEDFEAAEPAIPPQAIKARKSRFRLGGRKKTEPVWEHHAERYPQGR